MPMMLFDNKRARDLPILANSNNKWQENRRKNIDNNDALNAN